MVAKIVTGKSIRGILIYNETKVDKGEARIIMASGFATDIDKLDLSQKIQRFKNLTEQNSRVKTNATHITLNFDTSDKLNLVKLQAITQTYMEQIGFGEQPFVAYQHYDSGHPHVHIATTILKRDGQRIKTHNIGRLVSEPVRKTIEEQFGLVKAEGRGLNEALFIKPAIYGSKPTKQTINSIVSAIIREYTFASLAEYNAILRQFNIAAIRGNEETMMFKKKGLIYSILDNHHQPIGVPLKASSLSSKPTLANLEKHFIKGLELKKDKRDNLRNRIDHILSRSNSRSTTALIDHLAKDRIAVIFRQNESGVIYGVTYIDHQQRVVFNGSDLGKNYSSKGILEKFEITDQRQSFSLPLHLNKGQGTNIEIGDPSQVLFEKATHEDPLVIGKPRRKKKKNQQHNLR
ncbi:MAG: relaxase [Sphingobacteriales bacterium]|nr:MAG: relaxase [Sphingobacteriales bacterium]